MKRLRHDPVPFASRAAAAAATALLAAGAPAHALEFCKPNKGASYRLAEGATHEGDLYTAGQTLEIAGLQKGDLVGWAQSINVTGEVAGDLIAAGQAITIQGRVGDTVRVGANSVLVQGVIDGDLLACAQTVTVASGAEVTGDVVSFAQILTVDGKVGGNVKASGQNVNLSGEVGGDLSATAGEVRLSGTVARDAGLTTDTLTIDPAARIQGDLAYKSREPLDDLAGLGVVAGKIDYERREEEKAERKKGSWFKWLLWRAVFLSWSLILGFVLLRLFRDSSRAIEMAVERDTLASLGVGFVLAIVLPVAAVIVCLLVVTLPLAIVTLMLWLIGWYIAKLPVALWLGRRILRAAGSSDPSPYLGLLLGLVVLTALLQIAYLWVLIYFATIFLGLGALVLGGRARVLANAPASSPHPV